MKRLLPLLLLLSACSKELVCPASETDCDGRCVPLATDSANCGACGVAVARLEMCTAATATCQPGIATCHDVCTDTTRDPANCGGCDIACGEAQRCSTEGGGTCVDTCDAPRTACNGSCVDLQEDHYNCGACSRACAVGEVCRSGACGADIQVACGSTNEVVPVTSDLAPAGPAHDTTTGGPTSIVVHAGAVLSANGYPQASVSIFPLDAALPGREVTVAGSDLQHIGVVDNVAMVSNASTGSLLFLTPAGDLVDELPLPGQAYYPNPQGFAAVGGTLYVALYGSGSGAGQSIAKVDLSTLSACVADPIGSPCGTVAGEIDLLSVPGAFDAPGLPFPSTVVEAGGRIYVSLANLKEASFSCGDACTYTAWAEPAGHGRLAVIDPGAGDAVTIVDLGAGCGNAGAMAVDGETLWVACGAWSFPNVAPGVLVPVDLRQHPPMAGAPLDLSPTLPGRLAFCGGVGYATDQASGNVVRFDPVARTAETPVEVCTMGPWGYAWASDVACGN